MRYSSNLCETSIVKQKGNSFGVPTKGGGFESYVGNCGAFGSRLMDAIEDHPPEKRNALRKEHFDLLFSGQKFFYALNHLVESQEWKTIIFLDYDKPSILFNDTFTDNFLKEIAMGSLSSIANDLLNGVRGKQEPENAHIGDACAAKMADSIDILLLTEDTYSLRRGVEEVLRYRPMECNNRHAMAAFRGAMALNDYKLMTKAAALSSVPASFCTMHFHINKILWYFDNKESAIEDIVSELEIVAERYKSEYCTNLPRYALSTALSYLIASGEKQKIRDFIGKHEDVEMFNLREIYSQFDNFFTSTDPEKVKAGVKEVHNELADRLMEAKGAYDEKWRGQTALDLTAESYYRLNDAHGLSKVLSYALKNIPNEEHSIELIRDSKLVELTRSQKRTIMKYCIPLIQKGYIYKGFVLLDAFGISDKSLLPSIRKGLGETWGQHSLNKEKGIEFLREYGNRRERSLRTG